MNFEEIVMCGVNVTIIFLLCIALIYDTVKRKDTEPTAEQQIIYVMVDDSGRVIQQLTPEEMRAYNDSIRRNQADKRL